MESSRKQSVQTLVEEKIKSKIEACYGAEKFKGEATGPRDSRKDKT